MTAVFTSLLNARWRCCSDLKVSCSTYFLNDQVWRVQGETSAIFEEGWLQPKERHSLHAMFWADGSQPEGAHWHVLLVHVSPSVRWLCRRHIWALVHSNQCVCVWLYCRGLPFIPHLDSLPKFNRSNDGPVRLPIVDKYKVRIFLPLNTSTYIQPAIKNLPFRIIQMRYCATVGFLSKAEFYASITQHNTTLAYHCVWGWTG